jgi:hypothetical protein
LAVRKQAVLALAVRKQAVLALAVRKQADLALAVRKHTVLALAVRKQAVLALVARKQAVLEPGRSEKGRNRNTSPQRTQSLRLYMRHKIQHSELERKKQHQTRYIVARESSTAATAATHTIRNAM